MGFLRKLKKRDDRFARVGKSKAAKRDAKAEERFYLENRNYAEQVYAKTQRSRFLTQVAFLCAARDVFHFGQKRLFALLQKAVRVGECCVQDNMFSVADLRDQLAEETGYYVAMNRVNGDFAFQETKRVVDEVTVIYLWALNDIYGMKAKRLARAYDGAEAVSKAMAHDSMQVCAKVKEIEDAGLRMRFCGKNAMDMAKEIASL